MVVKIVLIYGGVSEGGVNLVVVLNCGKNSGLEVGYVLVFFCNSVFYNVDFDG